MLLKKAALRRFILPAVLRELLLSGCVLESVVLVHCEETCCCSWSQDSTAVEVACPKRALLIRLATQRECCVTRTSMRCLVFSGLRLRQTRKNSCPSSHKPFMHIFRFWVDFALKRVRDLIRFLSVKLTSGSRILEIVGLHAVVAKT